LGRNKKIIIEMINGISDNIAYMAHMVLPNFDFTQTSYMLGTLDEMLTSEQNIKSQNSYANNEVKL